MRASTWVIGAGLVIAILDFQPALLGPLAGGWDSNNQTGTGFLGLVNPIDNKLPLVQNVGVWIIGAGLVMRFAFGK